MAELIGMILAALLFAALPAFLLGAEYTVAVGVAYLFASMTLLALFWELRDIKEKIQKSVEVVGTREARGSHGAQPSVQPDRREDAAPG